MGRAQPERKTSLRVHLGGLPNTAGNERANHNTPNRAQIRITCQRARTGRATDQPVPAVAQYAAYYSTNYNSQHHCVRLPCYLRYITDPPHCKRLHIRTV